jgi:Domain of unknown function (DUF1735)
MKKIKLFLSLMISTTLLMQSCIKDDMVELTNQGSVFVKMSDGPSKALYYEPFNTVKKVTLFNIRRDVNSPAELAKSATITVQDAPELLTAYNTDNSENFEPLPTSIFSLVTDPSIVKSGDKYTITFGPNEFAKNFEISLDGSKWDLSKKFGIAYKVVDAPGSKITSAQKNIVTLISLKNKYDGVYLLTGAHNRVPYNFPYSTTIYMMTAGANSVIYYWPDAGSYGHPIGVGPDNDLSWYGPAISPVVEFDPVTNEVARVFNNPPNGTVITKFTLAGVANSNKYDPATKKMYISWNYANNPLRAFVDTLTYIKPRQ